jgi:hypothetical protein
MLTVSMSFGVSVVAGAHRAIEVLLFQSTFNVTDVPCDVLASDCVDTVDDELPIVPFSADPLQHDSCC